MKHQTSAKEILEFFDHNVCMLALDSKNQKSIKVKLYLESNPL